MIHNEIEKEKRQMVASTNMFVVPNLIARLEKFILINQNILKI